MQVYFRKLSRNCSPRAILLISTQMIRVFFSLSLSAGGIYSRRAHRLYFYVARRKDHIRNHKGVVPPPPFYFAPDRTTLYYTPVLWGPPFSTFSEGYTDRWKMNAKVCRVIARNVRVEGCSLNSAHNQLYGLYTYVYGVGGGEWIDVRRRWMSCTPQRRAATQHFKPPKNTNKNDKWSWTPWPRLGRPIGSTKNR
jgi:hypothetical protein